MYRTILPNTTVLGSLLVFLTSALRMRDTRSTSVAIITFNRLLPFFRKPSPVRDFLCDHVLKAAISSFNEPYFVDSQNKLAGLIAQIISLDEEVPRGIIAGLPGMKEEKVGRLFKRLAGVRSPTQGGAVVLELLSGLRGVSIHELGRMERPRIRAKEVVEADMGGVVELGIKRGGEEELEGVAGMFS